jgi:hypothetical protein
VKKIENLEPTLPSSTEMLSVSQLTEKLKNQDKTEYKKLMLHILEDYGCALHCNRFAIGNCHEYAIEDIVRATGLTVQNLQDAVRVDLNIKEFGRISIKYSSTGDIKLHNSNNVANKDMSMVDTLLVTPTDWWILTTAEMAKVGLDVKEYLKNSGDGLQLKRTILTELTKKKYPHRFAHSIEIEKKKCKNKETSRVFYDFIKSQLASSP